jgi:hypothetical protein
VGNDNQIKSEPVLDNYDEFGYPDSSYVEDGNCSESKVDNPESTEIDLMHVDGEKSKRFHKGSPGGRLLRNPVWDYFVKLENRSSCTTCGFSLTGFNTSNEPSESVSFESEKLPQNRVKGRLNKNPVHNFFTRQDSYSNCNCCSAKMLGHNPTTLTKHLESHHMEQFREFREMYRLAWENKRKMMKEKTDQEDNFEQWNEGFENSYNDVAGDITGYSDNFIEWIDT